MNDNPTAKAQQQLADAVRNPEAAAPAGIQPERMAVYTRLIRNNLSQFLNACFSDSRKFIPAEQWQDWQNRFLEEARPDSPFFRDIPVLFLRYLSSLDTAEMPSENLLEMMAFETDLLHAETVIQEDSDGIMQENSVLKTAESVRIKRYGCDFISSDLEQIEAGETVILTWRNRADEVLYQALDELDALLLQSFAEQAATFAEINTALSEMAGGQDISDWLRETVERWLEAGVLVAE